MVVVVVFVIVVVLLLLLQRRTRGREKREGGGGMGLWEKRPKGGRGTWSSFAYHSLIWISNTLSKMLPDAVHHETQYLLVFYSSLVKAPAIDLAHSGQPVMAKRV